MNRLSAERAGSTSPRSRTAPAMSSRYVCPPDRAPRTPEDSGTAEAACTFNPALGTPEDSGSAEAAPESRARKCVMSEMSASFMLE
eukprot:3887147-Alexandrium_andersonii.AAC.1